MFESEAERQSRFSIYNVSANLFEWYLVFFLVASYSPVWIFALLFRDFLM